MQYESDSAGKNVLAIIDSLPHAVKPVELRHAILDAGIRPWLDIPDLPLREYPTSERGPKIHWCLRHGITRPSHIAVLLDRTVGSVNGHLQDMRLKGLLPLAVLPRSQSGLRDDKRSSRLMHESATDTLSSSSAKSRRTNQSKTKRRKTPSFFHAEVFPHIAQAISTAPQDGTGFVDHNSIISAILSEQELKPLIAKALASRPKDTAQIVATDMLSWFSQKITEQTNPWGDFFVLEKRGDKRHETYSYRLKTPATSDASAIEFASLEGNLRLVLHFRRERDPTLAKAKREEVFRTRGILQCEACDFTMEAVYPGIEGDVFEVHHRQALSKAAGPVRTKIKHLALLCANCHRAIHRTALPMMTVEDFRLKYFEGARE